jgi:hypothetical protein
MRSPFDIKPGQLRRWAPECLRSDESGLLLVLEVDRTLSNVRCLDEGEVQLYDLTYVLMKTRLVPEEA